MITVIHTKCGKPAFYFVDKVASGEIVRANNVIYLDGTHATPHMRPVCGSCHALISFGNGELKQVEQHWSDWFVLEGDKWRINK